MRDKFTSVDLYNWTASQVAGTYFQAYQLAYDVASRTERSYRFELGLTDSGFQRELRYRGNKRFSNSLRELRLIFCLILSSSCLKQTQQLVRFSMRQ